MFVFNRKFVKNRKIFVNAVNVYTQSICKTITKDS